MRGVFCFRRRRLCLLIRREALLCSVELLNLQAKGRVSVTAQGRWGSWHQHATGKGNL